MATRIQPKPAAKPERVRLEWKRGKKDQLVTAARTTWESRCGDFKVERLDSCYGLGTSYCGVAVLSHGEVLLYRGKSRSQDRKSVV